MAAEAVAVEATAPQPVTAQVIGNAFVQQYYQILHNSPELVYRFYQDISKLGRPEEDGSMSITTTMLAINDKIVSLNFPDFRAEIKSIDAQDSYNGGVNVLVTGYLTGKDNKVNNFAQNFFLAPQDKGYYVLNDIFRYVDVVTVNPPLVTDVVLPVTPEPVPVPLVQETHVSEQSIPSAEETIVEEVNKPTENGDVLIVEEVPVPKEVVYEAPDDTQVVVKSSAEVKDVPKKSYASIVRHLKESAASFSPPLPHTWSAPPKKIEQVKPTVISATDKPVSVSQSVDGNNQEGEADGHSIYVKGLPMNATVSMLEEVFKKFGTVKSDGIQVRSIRQHSFCFGFVEYEEASSVQKALEASPIAIGERQVTVEEKRSSNSRGNNRGRYQSGRGSSGFRNEGGRGRGNYGGGGGGRGYNNNRGGDFNGRSEFGNRGGNRGGSSLSPED